eukprot:CAMPEP_0113852456 /NCGR_PEP_ID=MMETSP0372-20130328/5522_1 /TAXON_ID=340204 /ORGANISM="Lankesteria abbotti" /LENGTH=84 /DNA_ID=CAMNT_0000824011 /DNA_START=60 /DNA_END=314 /DNA_ORIENTATION=+ /assembly_acc=CAM_ASM_000359
MASNDKPNTSSEQALLDDPDDEFEEFEDEMGIDADCQQWEADWDASGWDDEDDDDNFVQRLQNELEKFVAEQQQQAPAKPQTNQ